MDYDEDVGLEGEPQYPQARTDLACGDCGSPMRLIVTSKTPFYGCVQYPDCKGTHGANRDGSPKGIPGNKRTREARMRAHAVFDGIWKQKLVRNRTAAYEWMHRALNLPKGHAHIAMFDEAQCKALERRVHEDFPSLRGRLEILLYDDPFE